MDQQDSRHLEVDGGEVPEMIEIEESVTNNKSSGYNANVSETKKGDTDGSMNSKAKTNSKLNTIAGAKTSSSTKVSKASTKASTKAKHVNGAKGKFTYHSRFYMIDVSLCKIVFTHFYCGMLTWVSQRSNVPVCADDCSCTKYPTYHADSNN